MTLNPWWNNWSDFAAMGGYGLYVWGSFGTVALVVAGELAALRARRTNLRHHADIDDDIHDDNTPRNLESVS